MYSEPIKLAPACKDYLWGGEKLRTDFGIVSDKTPLAEAWVLSAHPAGESRVVGGRFDGMTFSAYLKTAGKAICGKQVENFPDFPLLIKLIDAKRDLSVQVHPDDRYAARCENSNGKTEMWVVLSAEPESALYYGFSRPVTADEVRRRIEDGSLTAVLNRVPVAAGDVFFISPGTVHAIGAGLVIGEIQQNSDITYRLYDYDRRDAAGNRRELHIDKALAVSRLIPTPLRIDAPAGYLASCHYFAVRRLTLTQKTSEPLTADSFLSVVAVEGAGSLTVGETTLNFCKGDSLFIPAQDGICTLDGNATLLLTTVPGT